MGIKEKFIVVEGNIGVGKTSLTRMLSADLGGTVIYEEFAENPLLPKFYKDPEKFAFPLELSFLSARFKQLETIFATNPGDLFIADYHFAKSYYFATVNLSDYELELYHSFYTILERQLREPDLLIYLHKNTEQLRSNITSRGRNYESGISIKYLEKLDKAYALLLKKTAPEKRLEIDSGDLDFVNNRSDYELIIKAIKEKL